MTKTPNEIKKGMLCCSPESCRSDKCPYQDHAPKYEGDRAMCRIMLWNDAFALIQKLEAQVPHWISVEDRLPEYGRYLVVTQNDCIAKIHTATYNNMGWWMPANFGDITHWMLLPELPANDKEET